MKEDTNVHGGLKLVDASRSGQCWIFHESVSLSSAASITPDDAGGGGGVLGSADYPTATVVRATTKAARHVRPGFATQAHFARAFQAAYGSTPSEHRRGLAAGDPAATRLPT